MRALWPSRALPAARVVVAAAAEDGTPSPPRLSDEFNLLHTQVARVRDIEVRLSLGFTCSLMQMRVSPLLPRFDSKFNSQCE